MTHARKVEQMKAMYAKGMTLRAIAERMNMTHQAVHQALTQAGVAMRPRGGNTGGHSRHRR
jgi:predicted DNA-binding protein YlxM (UPF0122 family)